MTQTLTYAYRNNIILSSISIKTVLINLISISFTHPGIVSKPRVSLDIQELYISDPETDTS